MNYFHLCEHSDVFFCLFVSYRLSHADKKNNSRIETIHTFFPQEKIQEVVRVGHSHFGLHLRPSQCGVDVAGALRLFGFTQLREPAPHISAEGRYGDEESRYRCEKTALISVSKYVRSGSKYKNYIHTF